MSLRAFVRLWLPASFMMSACAGTPPVSLDRVSADQAKAWLGRHCSVEVAPLTGQLVVKSDSADFRGQFLAQVRFEKGGAFVLEVTHLLGGTWARLTSDSKTFNLEFPSKPARNRTGLSHYLGLEVPILSRLLHGDLPCPDEARQGRFRVSGHVIEVESGEWIWTFMKGESPGEVPVRVILSPRVQSPGAGKVELEIVSWNSEGRYAEKVVLRGPEGMLKWIWKNRQSGVQ
jgi:hypothetical protein